MNWGVFAFYEDWFKAEAYKRSPAKAAKDRLRAIIAADREAVPCGSWVKDFRHRIATDDATGSWRVAKFDKRPHYRYEVRR